ncbi:hypothetical protein BGW39_002245 [Mortierella sp. 14UC]|nr:hypothetical protein BGW39_002245 [Mortierella sp. 14UC]
MACVCAFYAKDPTKYAYAAAVLANISQVPSNFYQIPTSTPEFWAAWTTENARGVKTEPEKKAVLETLVTAAEVSNTVESLSVHDPKGRYSRLCATMMTANARKTTTRQKALAVFRAIDTNRDNQLSIEECKDFLVVCEISSNGTEGRQLLEGLFQSRRVATAEDFCTWFTKSWIHSAAIAIPRLPNAPRGQAKLVNLSGTIESQEFYSSMGAGRKFAIQSFLDEGKIRIEE